MRTMIGIVIALLSTLTAEAAAAGVTVAIDPKNPVTVVVGASQQFSAAVAGTTNTAVSWSLSPPSGVSASAIGTIDGRGKYMAPAVPLPGFAGLTVTVTSAAQPTVSASNTITVRNPTPALSSVAPVSVPLGAFSLTVAGSGFVNGARVFWNGAPLATTFVSSSKLTATGTTTQLGSVNVNVVNPGPGAVSAAFAVTVTSRVSVSISPIGASVMPGRTTQFQAMVSGSTNQAVTWGVVGSPAAGVIDGSGVYTAPVVPRSAAWRRSTPSPPPTA